jgi:DNA-binding PadR family transcriptional regulator
MSYVDILILRHLYRRPVHGYELRKQVEASTGFVLHNNSLYPALKRFEEGGAVVKTLQPQEGRPPRHVYELTDVGRELLHDMLAELPAEMAGDDIEFLSRLGQFSLLEPAERQAVLDARDKAVQARLDRLRGLLERARNDDWGALVTEEMIRRGEQERAWLAGLGPLATSSPTGLRAKS